MDKFNNVLETQRLTIRPLMENDYQEWLHGFQSRFPSKNRHDDGQLDLSECTREWFKGLVSTHQELALSDISYIFAVFHKESQKHIGMVDVSTIIRGEFQWGRLGYTIHNQFWQKGYGTEATKGALSLAFNQLGYHRIEAHINLDNPASKRLAERVGMKFECIRERFIYEDGEWTDHLIYTMNKGKNTE